MVRINSCLREQEFEFKVKSKISSSKEELNMDAFELQRYYGILGAIDGALRAAYVLPCEAKITFSVDYQGSYTEKGDITIYSLVGERYFIQALENIRSLFRMVILLYSGRVQVSFEIVQTLTIL